MTRTLRRAARAAAVLTTMLAAAPAAADAGTYTVLSCRDHHGQAIPIADAAGGWRHESGPFAASGLYLSNLCNDGDFLRIGVGGSETWPDAYVYSQAIFRPPADTRIRAFSLTWDGYAIPSDASKAGFLVVDTDGNRWEEHVGSGYTGDRTTAASGLDAGFVTLHAGCQRGGAPCGGGEPGSDARARLQHSAITLSDDATPTGTVYGPAVTSATWTGAQTLKVDVEDRGAGAFGVRVRVGDRTGTRMAFPGNPSSCSEHGATRVFTSPRPCQLDPAAADVPVDASAYLDGTYDVSVLVEDAAGNVRELVVGRKLFDSRPPVLDGDTTLTGTAREGEQLACVAPVISGQDPEVAYAWFRSNADGSGRTAVGSGEQTYELTSADIGRKLVCRVTATDGGGTSFSESTLTSGPFADGGTVVGICDGMPSGPRDACGDLDGDGVRNRDDDDRDGDGVVGTHDPDDLDPSRTGREPGTPTDEATGSNASTTHTFVTTTTTNERTVQSEVIPDGPTGEPNGRFASPAATLTSAHEGTSSRTLRVSHGRRLVIAGRLLAPDGSAIQGAKLEVTTQDRVADAAFRPFGAVLTEADGRYRFILPPGPSRTVRVGYRARFGDTTFAQTTDLTVLVRAGLRFKVSHKKLRNGRTARFGGRVLGPRSGHRFAEVMVRVGRRWIVVCSVRTDAKGAFGCRHRFTKTFTRTRYVFRARVRRQAGLPYEPATSATRTLVVRP